MTKERTWVKNLSFDKCDIRKQNIFQWANDDRFFQAKYCIHS